MTAAPSKPEERRHGRPRRRVPHGIVLSTALLAVATTARAEPGPVPAAHPHAHADATGRCATPSRHHLMWMAGPGVTDVGDGFFSAGLGYEYRVPLLGDRLGVGAMFELMAMPAVHPMAMGYAALHPYDGLFLQAGAGVTHSHGAGDTEMRTGGVFRLSTGYDFHVGTWMVGPYVNADLADEPGLSVSAGLGAGFML